jgi:D-galactarolactone isomerase
MSADAHATMPAGACDCHVHVYDDGFALAPSATFKPPHAPWSAYRAVQRAIGLARAVLVQPTGYGFDNRCLLNALAQAGDSARGVAALPPGASDAELERLHQAGVRAVRYMMLPGSGALTSWDTLPAMAARLAPIGWHVNLQLDGRELPHRQALIDALPCAVVIDHTGKFLEPVATGDPAFRALLDVLERPQRWVKLSAPYETSRTGPPGYDDVARLARALLDAHPDRCLWASNWPHPNRLPQPSDARMLALLDEWTAGDERLRRRVLVENPAAAYGF